MLSENKPKARTVDKEVNKSWQDLKKHKLVSHAFIKKLKLLLIIIFIVGFISAVVWMISGQYF